MDYFIELHDIIQMSVLLILLLNFITARRVNRDSSIKRARNGESDAVQDREENTKLREDFLKM